MTPLLAAIVVSWPATAPAASVDEVQRLVGKRFGLEHCVRAADGSGCPADALWIQFQLAPAR